MEINTYTDTHTNKNTHTVYRRIAHLYTHIQTHLHTSYSCKEWSLGWSSITLTLGAFSGNFRNQLDVRVMPLRSLLPLLNWQPTAEALHPVCLEFIEPGSRRGVKPAVARQGDDVTAGG